MARDLPFRVLDGPPPAGQLTQRKPWSPVMQRDEQEAQPLTLALLPGLHGTGGLYQPFVRALPHEVRTRVVAFPATGRRSIEEYARLAASQLPEGPVVLLAESFSGLVALALLASGAASPRAVVFCASFAEPPRPFLLGLTRLVPRLGSLIQHAPSMLLRWFAIGWTAGGQELALLRAELSEASPGVLAHRLRLVATYQAPEIGRSAIPCYYLQGTRDRLVPSRAARWFQRHFTSFRVERLEGPHFLLLAEPQECARRVVRILEEVAGGSMDTSPSLRDLRQTSCPLSPSEPPAHPGRG